MRTLLPIFVSIFLAELGDKTQLATLLFATDHSVSHGSLCGRLGCFSVEYVVSGRGWRTVKPFYIPCRAAGVAALGFIAIGVWMLFHVRA